MKVLTGLLDTPEGKVALDAAVEETRRTRGSLLLVVYVPSPHDPQGSRAFSADLERARASAERTAERLRASGLTVSVHAPIGPLSPSDAVLQVAGEEDVDLIVIGLRRRSRVGKLVMGSNAQDILLGAPMAVMAVKPPREE